jgi:hypothetical protein
VGRHLRPALAVAGLLSGLTLVYSWPLALALRTALPHDAGDPLLVTWILWWSTQTVPLTAAWWNAPAFYPATGVFAFSETLLGLAPITAPIIHAAGEPILAYNVAFLASYLLSGLGAYVLGFVITRRHDASIVAGVAYAFAPYRLSHLQHLQLLSSYWMPVTVAALHLYDERPDHRRAALFAGAWLLQSLACGYYFFFLSLFAALWLVWFVPARWTMASARRLAAWWLAAGLVLLPLLLGYHRIQSEYGFQRAPSEIAYYSGDIAGLASASPDSWLWSGVRATAKPESEAFPGATIPLLLVAGLAFALRVERRRDAGRRFARDQMAGIVVFYAVALVLTWLLSLGPAPSFEGRTLGIPGPYAVLMWLPGFDGVRVPARLWMTSVLCLSVLAAIVLASVRHSPLRRLLVALACTGMLLDGWPARMTLAADPGVQVTHSPAVARLGLPLDGNETETMFGAIAQDIPVFNGYSGYTAPQHRALADLLARHDPSILQRLAANGPIEVIVRRALDPAGGWRQYVASYPGSRVAEETAGWTAYELPRSGAVPPPAPMRDWLPIARVTASVNAADINAVIDGDLVTRWHAERQLGAEVVTADLGLVTTPAAVELSLGTYSGQFPRRLEVASSADGVRWDIAWDGDTALLTYDGAVRDPRRAPIRVPLSGRPARFVQLRQTGSDPARGWTIVELGIGR